MSRTFFVGGNWKMNGSVEQYQSLINNLLNAKLDSSVEVVISPPSLYLLPSQKLLEGKNIALGAQTPTLSHLAPSPVKSPWLS